VIRILHRTSGETLHTVQSPSLAGADLRGLPILFAQLAQCDLTGVDLRGAELSNSDLTGTKLVGSDSRRSVPAQMRPGYSASPAASTCTARVRSLRSSTYANRTSRCPAPGVM